MIDRFTAQIKDVEEDYIVTRLKLRDDSNRKEGQVARYIGDIKGLKENKDETDSQVCDDRIRIYYYPHSKLLRLDGSLHTFAHGYNNTLFTCQQARDAIKALADIVGIELKYFFFTRIEFGINMFMPKKPMKYIEQIFSYNNQDFIPMTPLRSTVYGVRCKAWNYEIKLYDKAYDAWIKRRIGITENILRFEVVMKKVYATDNGFKDINASGLLGKMYYVKMKKILREIFKSFRLRSKYLDFSNPDLDPKQVEKYMFITSGNYRLYLRYLSEYGKMHDKPNLRDNATTRRRRLMKELKPMLTTDLVDEFKSEFSKTLKDISDKKSGD